MSISVGENHSSGNSSSSNSSNNIILTKKIDDDKSNDVVNEEDDNNGSSFLESLKGLIISPFLGKKREKTADSQHFYQHKGTKNIPTQGNNACCDKGEDGGIISSLENQFQTNGQFWTMWHAITWLSTHSKYLPLSYVLAEYATKTALTYMPPEKAKHYSALLCMCGFDVKNVNLGILGQTVYKIATSSSTTASTSTQYKDNSNENTIPEEGQIIFAQNRDLHGHANAYNVIMNIESLLHEIISLSKLPFTLSTQAHEGFANFLSSKGSLFNIHPTEFATQAEHWYGDTKHWLQSGFALFLKKIDGSVKLMNNNNNSKQQLIQEHLASAYHDLMEFVKKATPVITEVGGKAINDLHRHAIQEVSSSSSSSIQHTEKDPLINMQDKT